MNAHVTRGDRFGFVRPAVDAHTLGIQSAAGLVQDAGWPCVVADAATCAAFGSPDDPASARQVRRWVRQHRITRLGFSYRLDPRDGAALLAKVVRLLGSLRLLAEQGGPVRAVYFAGLPEACRLVQAEVPTVAGVFCGDETPAETLRVLGIPSAALPRQVAEGVAYDEDRLAFGRELVHRGDYLSVQPPAPGGYPEFGTRRDTLVERLRCRLRSGQLPVTRAHVGPYLADRRAAVGLFMEWARRLAASGHLDVLSIGTSQLTQSHLGEDWTGLANGGGVPLATPEEFAAAYQASRPMLVRTYAGTRNIPALARMYEETINIAWHALSLWWFCRIDGRGPYDVRENLNQHIQTIKYVATTGKPLEPNVPHHFAFRGADDVTCVVSAVLAARLAKALGIRCLVLQVMLNTPRHTWGVQDLAKARAMLTLVREHQDDRFRVILQPRAGLDYFSPDLERAKSQLAAATALADDIEPRDAASPPVVHVVSYCEAVRLADPTAVDESIQITRHALREYRRLRAAGKIDDMTAHPDVAERTAGLLEEARTVLAAIQAAVPDTCSADGLYEVFARGFLPVPYLWECRDQFSRAVAWQTRLVRGSVKVVDEHGRLMTAAERLARLAGQDLRQQA